MWARTRCGVSNEADPPGEQYPHRVARRSSAPGSGRSSPARNVPGSTSVVPEERNRHTTGDNSVDDVDNSAAAGAPGTSGGEAAGSSGDSSPRGADLARAALQAAREQTKARGRGRPPKRLKSTGARRKRGWSGPGTDDRDPQPLGRVASRIAADHGWAERLAGGQVFGRWAALVGDEVAEHTKPVALQEGELTVQAESTAWATQLRLLQRQILKRIADALGKDVVRRIKVQGPAAPSWRYGPRHIPGRGPRDTYG